MCVYTWNYWRCQCIFWHSMSTAYHSVLHSPNAGEKMLVQWGSPLGIYIKMPIDLKEFWQWCMLYRTIWLLLDSVHHLVCGRASSFWRAQLSRSTRPHPPEDRDRFRLRNVVVFCKTSIYQTMDRVQKKPNSFVQKCPCSVNREYCLTNELHGAKPFLRSHQSLSYERILQHFMEPECIRVLVYSQEPSTGQCSEPDQSILYHPVSL
jgi:hypothetical protein